MKSASTTIRREYPILASQRAMHENFLPMYSELPPSAPEHDVLPPVYSTQHRSDNIFTFTFIADKDCTPRFIVLRSLKTVSVEMVRNRPTLELEFPEDFDIESVKFSKSGDKYTVRAKRIGSKLGVTDYLRVLFL